MVITPQKTFTYKRCAEITCSCTRTQYDWVTIWDKSQFKSHGLDGKRYVGKLKREVYHWDCLSPTVKFPIRQMAWVNISRKRIIRLKLILNFWFLWHLFSGFLMTIAIIRKIILKLQKIPFLTRHSTLSYGEINM